MPIKYKNIDVPGLVKIAETLRHTGATNQDTIIKQWTYTNTTGTARVLQVWKVASGGSTAAANKIIASLTIPPVGTPGNVVSIDKLIGQVLASGDFIKDSVDVDDALSVMGSVVQIS